MVVTGETIGIDFAETEKVEQISYLSSEEQTNACPTIRILSPFSQLSDQIRLISPVYFHDKKFALKKDQFYMTEVVLIQRLTFLKDYPILKLRGPSQKIIYDIDDLLIRLPSFHPSFNELNKMKERILDNIKYADVVTVSTERLKENLQSLNKNIIVVPNYIDPDIWLKPDTTKNHDQYNRTVIAFVGTPTHYKDLEIVIPAIKRLCKEYKDRIVFRFFGCFPKELEGLEGVEFVSGLIKNYREFAFFLKKQHIDIALAPLYPDEFNECKSNIKFLEYSICQIPGIYSRLTPYAESIRDGETGILCNQNHEDWYQSIKTLIENTSLRRSIAENAYRDVLNRFILDREKASQWLQIIESLKARKNKVKVLIAQNGSYSLQVSINGNRQRMLHSAYNPYHEARLAVDRFHCNPKDLIVVLGLGLGYHLKELIKKYPSSKVLVIESSPDIYQIYKRLTDNIDPKNVRFIIGYPYQEAINEITVSQIKEGLPAVRLFYLSSFVNAFKDYYQPIIKQFEKEISFNFYQRLRYKKFKKESYTICLLDLGYFLKQELVNAITSLGHNVVTVRMSKSEDVGVVLKDIIKMITEKRPDFILTVNHLGFDEDGLLSSFLYSIEMPVAVWYVDSPNIIIRAHKNNVKENICLFVWDSAYIDNLKKIGFKHVTYLPLATDPTIFKPKKVKQKIAKKYRSSVSFVGNSMLEVCRKCFSKLPPNLHYIANALAERLARSRLPFERLLDALNTDEQETINRLDEKLFTDLEEAVYWKATMIYRHNAIYQLKEFYPTIYGDKGWKEILDHSFRIKPSLNYYTQLPLLYNLTDVNFNTTSLQMPMAVNQRVFDVPASGGFLLTDNQQALEELFDIKKEVVTYSTYEEIPDLINYYLKHPDSRSSIVKAARERVLKSHTYLNRISEIIQYLKTTFQ